MPDAPGYPNLKTPTRPASLMAPSSIYLTGEEWLRVTTVANVSVTLTVVGRVLVANTDEVIPFVFTHTPNSNRTIATQNQALPEGWLLGVSVFASSGTPAVGAVWISLDIIRGFGAVGVIVQSLTAGFCSTSFTLSWPGSSVVGPTGGTGNLRAIVGTTPAAGADITETVPTNAKWQLLSFAASLTTAAAVATRTPDFLIDDGTNIDYQVGPTATQAASLTRLYAVGASVGNAWQNDAAVNNWPGYNPMLIPSGGRIRTSTGSIQAADQWTSPKYTVLEWMTV